MSFEIRERDLLARIGRLETKSGILETPILLPVINPAVQPISPKKMQEEFGCTGLMTNAYIIKKHSESKAMKIGVHRFLEFNGVIMTDSGAYQILVYGGVDTTNKEIIHFQETIGTDIGTILDVPTGWGVSEKYARYTVEETLKRAKAFNKLKSQDDILWNGPVQGGVYLNWVAKSAKAMSKLPFQIHALGSPTPVMEQYFFDTLVDMIMTAKQQLPPDRPLHLFGAGHPFMFALAIALGCDLFDSAAYAIYAREDRYMTDTGTLRLREIEHFPCSCPVCTGMEPSNVKRMAKPKRQELLARHNLHVSFSEIKRIKQAITEGRLWEHLEMKSYGHPALLQALKRLEKYKGSLEAQSPVSKRNGLLFYGADDLIRPEVLRHSKRLFERYSPPEDSKILLLLPQTRTKPFHKSTGQCRLTKEIENKLGQKKSFIHTCTCAQPFGIIPIELDEIYPLSQHETVAPMDSETVKYVAQEVRRYIATTHYRRVILLQDGGTLVNEMPRVVRRTCLEKKIPLTILNTPQPWDKKMLESVVEAARNAVGEKA
jgi:7-cyano-7-deazaguanine tRNA-ribosyltransferase